VALNLNYNWLQASLPNAATGKRPWVTRTATAAARCASVHGALLWRGVVGSGHGPSDGRYGATGVICALASGADRLSPQPLYPRSDKSRPINSSDQTAAPAAVAE